MCSDFRGLGEAKVSPVAWTPRLLSEPPPLELHKGILPKCTRFGARPRSELLYTLLRSSVQENLVSGQTEVSWWGTVSPAAQSWVLAGPGLSSAWVERVFRGPPEKVSVTAPCGTWSAHWAPGRARGTRSRSRPCTS